MGSEREVPGAEKIPQASAVVSRMSRHRAEVCLSPKSGLPVAPESAFLLFPSAALSDETLTTFLLSDPLEKKCLS